MFLVVFLAVLLALLAVTAVICDRLDAADPTVRFATERAALARAAGHDRVA